MSKFNFDFEDGRTRFVDEEGVDLPGVEAVQGESLRTLAEIIKDVLPRSDRQTFGTSIRDACGRVVYSAKVTVSGTWHELPSA